MTTTTRHHHPRRPYGVPDPAALAAQRAAGVALRVVVAGEIGEEMR